MRNLKYSSFLSWLAAAVALFAIGDFGSALVNEANATPAYAQQTGLACGRCHTNPSGGGPRTAFGNAFAKNGHKVPGKK